jgi:glycine cleavage system H protein
MDPKNLRYTETHEWAHLEGDVATVGISQFAADQLTDITNVGLPKLGKKVEAGKPFGEIETVKAVSDLYAPVSGEVIEVNSKLEHDPLPVQETPFGAGWIVKIKVAPGTTLDHLKTFAQYQEQIASEGH